MSNIVSSRHIITYSVRRIVDPTLHIKMYQNLSNRKQISKTEYEPDMNESFTLIIIDGRDSDFPEYDDTVRCGTTSNFDQIVLDCKPHEFGIG